MRAFTHGHAPVNGIRMYWERHEPADAPAAAAPRVPLLLLPGGGSTIDVTWGRMLPLLARRRSVIALEEQGHGRSSARPASAATRHTFEASADDAAVLLAHLHVAQADVFGFSNGAQVAMQLAMRHPACVRKLVFASAFTRRDGAVPELWQWLEQADFASMPQALKDAFLRVNPDPAALRAMHDQDLARIRSFVDFPDAQVAGVRAPTLIVLGDRDVVQLAHAQALAQLMCDARLLVLPAEHGAYLGEATSAPQDDGAAARTAPWIEAFLNSP